jgi:hypothetical protein
VNPPASMASGAVEPAEPAAGDGGDRNGVSVLRLAGHGLPLASGSMAGVAVTGDDGDGWLEECARVVAPAGRLLLDPAPADAAGRLEAAGLRVLAREGAVLLAARTGAFR